MEIEKILKQLPNQPGVYQMLDKHGKVIYVGKAKDLKKRVTSYFRKNLDNKTIKLVNNICDILVTITNNEKEALLLENTLIKKLKPKYNIIFKDDKTYPYICVTANDEFPRIVYFRGKKNKKNKYFGPYSSPGKAKNAVEFIQKVCKIRSCTNSFFKNRTKPCLQYQIKRCTAPCVNLITKEKYKEDIDAALKLLKGDVKPLLQELKDKMQRASGNLDYELAAVYRDNINAVQIMSEKQSVVNLKNHVRADVFALVQGADITCLHIVSSIDGEISYSKQFFYNTAYIIREEHILENIILQFYLSNDIRDSSVEIILPEEVDEDLLLHTLKEINIQATVKYKVKGDRKSWLDIAMKSAKQGAELKSDSGKYALGFYQLQQIMELELLPKTIECFDISHTSGSFTVASCVVMDVNGPLKSSYKKFNIQSTGIGDDYLAMQEVLTRRYEKEKELPDLVVIDGGKGQLTQAVKVMQRLGLNLNLVGVAKGEKRKAGLETIYRVDNTEVDMSNNDYAFKVLQMIRDEAHRFAIQTHRKKREKITSILEQIKGVGAKKRTALLEYFGGITEIESATIEELSKVEGVNLSLATEIYNFFHSRV